MSDQNWGPTVSGLMAVAMRTSAGSECKSMRPCMWGDLLEASADMESAESFGAEAAMGRYVGQRVAVS